MPAAVEQPNAAAAAAPVAAAAAAVRACVRAGARELAFDRDRRWTMEWKKTEIYTVWRLVTRVFRDDGVSRCDRYDSLRDRPVVAVLYENLLSWARRGEKNY